MRQRSSTHTGRATWSRLQHDQSTNSNTINHHRLVPPNLYAPIGGTCAKAVHPSAAAPAMHAMPCKIRPANSYGPIGQLFFSFFPVAAQRSPTQPSETPRSHSSTHTKQPTHTKQWKFLSGLPFGPISPSGPGGSRFCFDPRRTQPQPHLLTVSAGAGARLTCRARSLGLFGGSTSIIVFDDGRTLRRWIIPFSVVPTLSGRLGRSIPQHSTPFVSTTFAWIWDGGKTLLPTLLGFGFLSCSFCPLFWDFLYPPVLVFSNVVSFFFWLVLSLACGREETGWDVRDDIGSGHVLGRNHGLYGIILGCGCIVI